jgi:uncharacterized protein YfdQ (DUF2303 family)
MKGTTMPTDPATPTETVEAVLGEALIAPTMLAQYDVTADVVADAVRNAIAATPAQPVGQHGLAFLLPDGYKLDVRDTRDLTDEQLPTVRKHTATFIGVRSLTRYVNRYVTVDTLGYITDIAAGGVAVLLEPRQLAHYQVDDHPVTATAHRAHRAVLNVRPTPAAQRWGMAIAAARIDQEQLLDLVVDGIGEIVHPDGAQLRDLIADLHAIRTTEARSVMRTGGQASIALAENVSLHGGAGSTVEVPEQIGVTFEPFAGIATSAITLDVRVKPRVGADGKVTFALEAPSLPDEIARVVAEIAEMLTIETGIEPLWIP